MSELALKPAVDLVQLLRDRQISARELLEHYLDRVAALNPRLTAVVTLDADNARARADELDTMSARDHNAGPLHGLPITVKDALRTRGIRSTSGADDLREHVPTQDAEAVRLLREAGCVVFGKTNLPIWSSDVESSNELFGTSRNPWDLDRTPGGSSGGSAAAIAAGLSGLELGSDIGGSVRIPASFCGVYAHKPSYGIVPQDGYMDRLDGTSSNADLNVLGPIARDVRDLSLALSVLTTPATQRTTGWELRLIEPPTDPARWRIGWWFDEAEVPVDPAVATVLKRAVATLADAGMHVEESHPAVDFATGVATYRALVYAAASVHHPEETAAKLGGTHRAWLDHDYTRRGLQAIWAKWFERFDVLLCPVVPVAAPRLGEATRQRTDVPPEARPHLHYTAWTGMVGAVHLPSTVLPIGHTPAGLPVGMQIVSQQYGDLTTLRVARAVDEVLSAYRVPPLATE